MVLLLIALVVVIIVWRCRNFTREDIVRNIRWSYRALKFAWILFYTRVFNITVDKLFENSAKKHLNKVFLHFENERWTFRDVQQRSNQVANYFQKKGYGKGDKIAIIMNNRPEYICLWIGLAKIGVVSVLINYNLRSKSLQHCLKSGSCKAVVFEQEFVHAMNELQDNNLLEPSYTLYRYNTLTTNTRIKTDVKSVDVAASLKECSKAAPTLKEEIKYDEELLYIYTSGTTGLPKAVIITHSRFIMLSTGIHSFPRLLENDIIYISLPLYHTNGTLCGIGQGIQFGNTIVLAKKFSATRFWSDCINKDVTVFLYIGEICRYLLALPKKLEDRQHKLRLILGNGLRADIWKEFITRFNIPKVVEFYGSTEGNCNLISVENTIGAVGYIPPFAFNFFKKFIVQVDQNTGDIIRDPKTGFALQCCRNEPGELIAMISQDSLLEDFKGYTDQEAQTNKVAFDVIKKGDKVFRSGDIFVLDEKGFFYFKDKLGDTFRWKGENVSTTEVENVLSTACGLKDTAVYGVEIPGCEGRAGMAAIVHPQLTLDLDLLAEKLLNELPVYARPLFIRLLKEMDMTGTFKVKKINLQKDGYDIRKVNDPIYFSLNGKYTQLNSKLYDEITSGKVRI